ncbi:winged helix-turn-helix transcriptional regulator [Candidatus Dependentiae bacterium]|nr:winged helix-turn-helix transcriptional regulator [Candidatus Dependentiae bacterium]
MFDTEILKYKAVADEVRFRILALLHNGELCVCDIENALKMSQPRISQHLLKLKNAGLISEKKVGKWKHFKISKEGYNFFKKSFYDALFSLKEDKILNKDKERLKKFKESGKCSE